jgi:hypothetical protein
MEGRARSWTGNTRAVSLMAQDPDLGPRLPRLLQTWHAARQRHEEQAPQREFAVIRACSGESQCWFSGQPRSRPQAAQAAPDLACSPAAPRGAGAPAGVCGNSRVQHTCCKPARCARPDLGPRLPRLLQTWHAARQCHKEQAPQREFAVIRACSGDISICALAHSAGSHEKLLAPHGSEMTRTVRLPAQRAIQPFRLPQLQRNSRGARHSQCRRPAPQKRSPQPQLQEN